MNATPITIHVPRAPAPSLAVVRLLDGVEIQRPGIKLRWGGPDANLFRGPVRIASDMTPTTGVFCFGTTGDPPRPTHDRRRDDMLVARVTVRVRYAPHAWDDGEDFARGVWFALHARVPKDYVLCSCAYSEPEFVKFDSNECPHWDIPVRLEREE